MFGFLATQLSSHPENVATEALAYVLRTSTPVSRAFEDYLRRVVGVPTGLHYITQSTGDDGATPDLAGLASDGSSPLLVEAKFWAGLTNHQPVSYLRRLPVNRPAMLLFVVPSVRLEVLWTEVLARLTAAGQKMTGEQAGGEYRSALVDAQRAIAMTSWRALLAALVDGAVAAGDRLARSDLDQLSGLCERMDSEGFVPLTGEDLSGSVAVRLLQYTDLINRSIDRMVSTGVASTKTLQGSSLNNSAAAGWWGRYFALTDIVCLLRFNAASWARDRATPIWLQIGYHGQPSVSAILDAVAPLRAQRNRVFSHRDSVDVAIDLPTNVEVDVVVESMMQQIGVVARYLTSLDSAAGPSGQ
ncbi:MAG: hypothetical protein JWR24_217 [Actinoallomurus sp.]|nr:hypothetical protein [Actinoallomurus sp.]